MAAIGFGLPKDAFTSLMKQVIQMVNSYSCLTTCVSLSVSNSLMLVYFFKVKVDGNKERIVAFDFVNDMMIHLLKYFSTFCGKMHTPQLLCYGMSDIVSPLVLSFLFFCLSLSLSLMLCNFVLLSGNSRLRV